MPGFLKSRNRAVNWGQPRYIDGIPYYPARDGRKGKSRYGQDLAEYAMMNGNLVIIADPGPNTPTKRPQVIQTIPIDYQGYFEALYPEIGDFALHNPGDYDMGPNIDEDFHDSRGQVDNTAWMNIVEYFDGRGEGVWRQGSAVQRYAVDPAMIMSLMPDGGVFVHDSKGRPVRAEGYTDDGRMCTVYEVHYGRGKPDDFLASLPAPPSRTVSKNRRGLRS